MTRKGLFEKLYAENLDKPKRVREKIISKAMRPYFQSTEQTESYVRIQMERKRRNVIARRIRLTRKINLQDFNYFVTVTYFYGQ